MHHTTCAISPEFNNGFTGFHLIHVATTPHHLVTQRGINMVMTHGTNNTVHTLQLTTELSGTDPHNTAECRFIKLLVFFHAQTIRITVIYQVILTNK